MTGRTVGVIGDHLTGEELTTIMSDAFGAASSSRRWRGLPARSMCADGVDAGVITVREAKHDRERLVPLHPSTSEALRRHAAEHPLTRPPTISLSACSGPPE
jgi:hypothetical protein